MNEMVRAYAKQLGLPTFARAGIQMGQTSKIKSIK